MSRASNLAGFSTSVVGTSPNNLIVGVVTATTLDAATLNVTSSAVIQDLTVNGTETIINTTTLDISDKTVGIASTSTPSNTTADGAGVVVYGGNDGNKSITWDSTSGNWVVVGGGVSATSFAGDGSGLTGVSSWESYDSWLFGSGG
jgi:hypothetical protein